VTLPVTTGTNTFV